MTAETWINTPNEQEKNVEHKSMIIICCTVGTGRTQPG